ncbi:serine/threonine-protein kinase [Streptomyces sedi]|uniref:Serine/threonine protein kinase n=1 Tax=Streptomyces sedi TaxID=555059 RepID=A0A5C4UQU2_9ACTN|nr:serine/threonine-protein kinase [Streptomyces sedi]TNM25785.1 serine/threonine protein kinase [Streptomyces sedi]
MQQLAEGDPREIGPYRSLAVLGHGGMGRVFLGRGPDGRLAAVKLIRAALGDDARHQGRFRREVATARRVHGSHTAAVLDADLDAPTPWLASAYIPGPSLRRVVAGEVDGAGVDTEATTVDVAVGVLPEDAVLRLAAGLTSALGEIHGAGLVHRDLKPDNILLTDEATATGVPGGDGGVRVVDFGVALATDDAAGSTRLTRTGWVVGSPPYMSPEQVEGAAITPASDIFSLGCVLVMASTGASPFSGSSLQQVLSRVLHSEPDLSALPDRVREVVAACLVKEPARRPSLDRLRELVCRVGAPAPPWPSRVTDLVREQRDEVARLVGPADEANTAGRRGSERIDKNSWNDRATDPTPFTADALLPERFVNDLDGEFVRGAAGPRPTEEAASRKLASLLVSAGCSRAMAGIYLEQRSPNPPVLVSATVFPLPDTAAASMAYRWLLQNAPWKGELTLWSARPRDDGSPRSGDYGEGYFERAHTRFVGRYLITTRSLRSDLLAESWLHPYVYAAAKRGCLACGPQSHAAR